MKLRKGKAIYKIPAHSEILSVLIFKNNNWYGLHIMPYEHLLQIKNRFDVADTIGFPKYCAITHDEIILEPAPDSAYKTTIRYLPPVMEF